MVEVLAGSIDIAIGIIAAFFAVARDQRLPFSVTVLVRDGRRPAERDSYPPAGGGRPDRGIAVWSRRRLARPKWLCKAPGAPP